MATQYKVTIEKIEKDVPFKDREWVSGTDEIEAHYEYYDSTHDVKTDIYEQVVDEIDIATIVRELNPEKVD